MENGCSFESSPVVVSKPYSVTVASVNSATSPEGNELRRLLFSTTGKECLLAPGPVWFSGFLFPANAFYSLWTSSSG